MADLIDPLAISMEQNLAGAHSDRQVRFHYRNEFLKPMRIGFGVVIQCRDVPACGLGDAGIAAAGESFVDRQGNDSQARLANGPEKGQRIV